MEEFFTIQFKNGAKLEVIFLEKITLFVWKVVWDFIIGANFYKQIAFDVVHSFMLTLISISTLLPLKELKIEEAEEKIK